MTPEEIITETLDGVSAFTWRPNEAGRVCREVVEALDAAGYVICCKSDLELLARRQQKSLEQAERNNLLLDGVLDSLRATNKKDQPPG